MKMYEMELEFSLDLGLKEINDFAAMFGIQEKMVLKDARQMTLKQTVPFIPDDKIIQKYIDTIKEAEFEKFTIEDCRFVGFKRIKEIEIKECSS